VPLEQLVSVANDALLGCLAPIAIRFGLDWTLRRNRPYFRKLYTIVLDVSSAMPLVGYFGTIRLLASGIRMKPLLKQVVNTSTAA
jgi:hypothetical protein